MKQNILAYLKLAGNALAVAIILGLLVSSIGWIFGWRTPVTFSNGMFFSGAALIVLGILSVMGGYSMRSDFKVLYSQSAGDMSLGDRTRRWVADMTQGYRLLVLMTVAGLLLVGAAILIGKMSGIS
jgi:hypothetical protein